MGNTSGKRDSERSSTRVRAVSSINREVGAIGLPTAPTFFSPTPRTENLPFPPPDEPEDEKTRSVRYIQSLIRRWRVEKMIDKALRRQAIANELFQTEINYVANLRLLIEVFAVPLKEALLQSSRPSNAKGDTKSKSSSTSESPLRGISASQSSNATKKDDARAKGPIITESQIRCLFSSAEILLQFQEVFLNSLRQKVEHWHYNQTLGEILSQMTPFMRLYAEYVGNFSEATELYQKLILKRGGNARFQSFLEDAYKRPEIMAVGDLDSFLVQPVQRLPRYKMFLEQLIKFTPDRHRDKLPLQLALEKVGDVVYYVNEKKRSHDLELQVFIAYGKIEPPILDLLAPGRALLLEGPLYFTKSLKEPRFLCTAFLFSDIMIIAKVPADEKRRLKFIARFELRTLNIGTILYHSPESSLKQSNNDLVSSSSSLSSSSSSIANTAHITIKRSATGIHTPQTSVGSNSSSLNQSQNFTPNSSSSSLSRSTSSLEGSSRSQSAKEPCFYMESKYNGQFCAWCWSDEMEANKWREALENAAEKVHLARETIPSTSEGKAYAFKSSINRHYTSPPAGSPSPLMLSDGLDEQIEMTKSSTPETASSPPAFAHNSVLGVAPVSILQHPLPTSHDAAGKKSADSDEVKKEESANAPPRQLRKFAERRKELGI